jgi:hypothetical protein
MQRLLLCHEPEQRNGQFWRRCVPSTESMCQGKANRGSMRSSPGLQGERSRYWPKFAPNICSPPSQRVAIELLANNCGTEI